MKINLGSCDNLLDPPWINIDRFNFARPGYEFRIMDLNQKWKFDDSSVSELRAHDIFEHLWPTQMVIVKDQNQTPTGLQVRRTDVQPKIWVMNEAHRVLRPGGTLSLIVPTTDGRGAYQDPTHVTWWTPNDMFYFCEHWAEWLRFHQPYGITARFRVQGCSTREEAWSKVNEGHTNSGQEVMKLKVILEAIK